ALGRAAFLTECYRKRFICCGAKRHPTLREAAKIDRFFLHEWRGFIPEFFDNDEFEKGNIFPTVACYINNLY
ncbi:hypothetical protein, partial [Okeania sp. SIO3B5]|uniref:hypothetical protein n=1 Tax=Okeania sp. SIO3B5 TaxID=2607811 RepID=UPI0025F56666